MIDKNSAELNIDRLKKQTLEQLQVQTVTAVVLALGSNHQAERHLASVRKNLTKLGKIKLSTAFQNPDLTATLNQPKPDYINQCVYLSLTSPITLQQLQQLSKQIECDCNRQRQVEKTAVTRVTMDIDILLVKLNVANEWIVIADRYPFKAHERAGMGELAIENYF